MKVIVELHDDESLVSEEVIQNLRLRYGDNTKIRVFPQSETPEGYIKFGIKELITIDQIEYHFDYKGGRGYTVKLNELKEQVMDQISDWFDEVVHDNEKGLD